MIFSRRTVLAGLAVMGVALTAVLAIVGQFGPDPQLSKVSLTVSDFAVSDKGGATDWAMVTFGSAALALFAALRRPRVGEAATLCLFAAGMFTAAIFHTDPGADLTPTGYVHRYSSIAAFIALPVAAWLLSGRFTEPRWGPAVLRRLVIADLAFMAAMLASATFFDRAWIGVAERLLLGVGLLLLGLVSFGVASHSTLFVEPLDLVPGDRDRIDAGQRESALRALGIARESVALDLGSKGAAHRG